MCYNHVLFFVFVVSFIIGICCWLLGCDIYLNNQCLAYNLFKGTAVGYHTQSDICSKCLSSSSYGCSYYYYYSCYSSYVQFSYSGNHTCYYEIDSEDESESNSQKPFNSYPLGMTKILLKDKNSHDCIDANSGLNTWISGIAFFSLCALILIFALIHNFKYIKDKIFKPLNLTLFQHTIINNRISLDEDYDCDL